MMTTDEKRMELLSMSKKDLVERLIYAEALWIESVKKRYALEVQLSAYENDLVLLDVADKLKMAEERIAELEEKQRWIPVSERLPEEDGYYYVSFTLSGAKYVTDIYYFKSDSKYKWYKDVSCRNIATFFDTVTHWTKRPQPPKEE